MRLDVLSQPMEDYLSAIYRAEQSGERVTTGAIAAKLGVSSASTTSMFQRLAGEGLVEYREYAGATLSERGARAALDVIRRHRLAERFLTDVLDISWDRVDRMAHRMEHVLPNEVIEGFDRILGNPATCPHGFPVPAPDGTVEEPALRLLSKLSIGDEAVIARVEEDDPELLRYLAADRLVPGARVRVMEKPPFEEPIVLHVNGERLLVGHLIAAAVRVDVASIQQVDT